MDEAADASPPTGASSPVSTLTDRLGPRAHARPLDGVPWPPLCLGFAAVYSVVIGIGVSLRIGPDQFSVFWPAAGVLGPVLALLRPGRWWPILGIAVLVELIAGLILHDPAAPLEERIVTIGITVAANAATATGFAALYRRILVQCTIEQAAPALGRFLICVALPTGVVSLIAMSLVSVPSDDYRLTEEWPKWWIADATGMIVFAPLILLGLKSAADRQFACPPLRTMVPTLVVVVTTWFVAWFVFQRPHSDGAPGHYAILLVLPLLAWPIARIEPCAVTLQLVGIAIAITHGLVESTGPFVHDDQSLADSIQHAQAVLLPTCITVLFVTASLVQQRWQAERRLATERRLMHLERTELVGSMAAGVAHDFGNLAIAVCANQAIIRRGVRDPDPTVDQAIDGLGEVADSARALTRSLLSLAEPNSGDAPADHGPTDLRESIRQALVVVGPLLERRATIRTDLGDRPVGVSMTSSDVKRIVSNLVVNACDAGVRGQVIDLALRITDTAAAIEVRDRGSGMSPEVRRQAFDPFFTTKPRGRGTGLGLAIVRRLVEDFGGTIQVTAADDETGTVVTITLPRTKDPVVEARAPSDPA